jgi:hypothetical protein
MEEFSDFHEKVERGSKAKGVETAKDGKKGCGMGV